MVPRELGAHGHPRAERAHARLLREQPANRAGQLVRIVMNLAVNARGAMPQGGKLSLEVADVSIDDATARVYATRTPNRDATPSSP